MKAILVGVTLTLVALVGGGSAYLLLGLAEVRADIPPPQWEVRLMKAALHASVKREAPEIQNPVAPTSANLAVGEKSYLDSCSTCHGIPGQPFDGQGPVLYPPAPEFPLVGTDYTEAQIFWVARHGIRRTGMLAHGMQVTDEDLWAIAAYIQHLRSLPPARQAFLVKPGEGHQKIQR